MAEREEERVDEDIQLPSVVAQYDMGFSYLFIHLFLSLLIYLYAMPVDAGTVLLLLVVRESSCKIEGRGEKQEFAPYIPNQKPSQAKPKTEDTTETRKPDVPSPPTHGTDLIGIKRTGVSCCC